MESRNFKLDTEWNMVQYPERPNGFGILLIGDERHFVNNNSSFWTQNEGKRLVLNYMKNQGYTVFSSNLYGRHWGSEKAIDLAKRLCSHIIRNEILNGSFHVMAEGMGALIALELLQQDDIKIRSLVLLNPVLSLSNHLEQERENKFFYKKLIGEVAKAHEIEVTIVQGNFENEKKIPAFNHGVPVKIIHVLAGNRAYKQSKILENLSVLSKEKNLPVDICYVLSEKKQQLGSQMVHFFKNHEQIL
jgi:hypothetical protein